VLAVNDEQFDRTAAKVVDAVPGGLAGKRVAAWGLTFKAGTDDLRMSPAIEVLKRLATEGAQIRAYDPAVHKPVAGLPDVEVVDDPYAAVDGAEVLVLLTEWDEFRWLDFDKVGELMASKVIVDGRNLLDRSVLHRRGFVHKGIGR
jgi:UDPglucose 6-dehydrogenase